MRSTGPAADHVDPSPSPAPPAGDPVEMRQGLIEHITSCWRTQALHVAVQLDLPDRMAAGPVDTQTLAQGCGCAADPLRRLLRALCALEICDERDGDRFALTAAGALLRREPGAGAEGLRAMALWWGGPMWSMWGELAYSVRTGASVRARQTGHAEYGFLDGQPDMAALFHDAMWAMTSLIADDVACQAVWQDARHLVDVGGGHGELAASIAIRHPQLRVTVLDRRDAEAGARAVFERRGVAPRVGFVAGDFFAGVPEGADRYLLKSILHNWDDAACQRILERCGAAAPRGARLLLVERVRPARLGPGPNDEALARTDLNMLAGLGGRERSLPEFAELLARAGFQITRIAATRHEFSLIEARRC